MKKLPLWVEKEGGLEFGCTRCGSCCGGGMPGHVWVDADEVRALAAHLGLEEEQFGIRYLRRVGTRVSLLEKANFDCVFWDAPRGCTVYAARPRQCRTYPFWPEVIRSRVAWREEAARCPGIRGLEPAAARRRYEPAEILRLANELGDT